MKDSRIESLILNAQLPARVWLHIVTDDLRIPVRIMETRRDDERQREVAASGASTLKFGFHNLGRAVDWACYDEQGVYITDGEHPYYRRCGLVWEALGWNWGGRWKKPDWDHAQFSNGINSFNDWWIKHPELRPVQA